MNRYLRALTSLAVLAAALPPLMAAASAHAQTATGGTVVLLPHIGGDARVSEEVAASALSTFRATLQAEGFTVRTLDEVEGLPEELRGCAEGPCVDEIRRRAATDYIGILTLWGRRGERTAPRQLVVSLIDGLSQDFYSRPDIEGDLNTTIEAAVRVVASHIRVGPGPFVFVDGSPEHAEVHIDGAYAGVIPYRSEIRPGTYDIEVRADGYETARRTEAIPPDVTWTARLTFNLEPAADGSTGARRSDAATVGHLIGASALGVAGLTLLGVDIGALALAGCEVSLANRGCGFGSSIDEGLFALYGVAGIVAVAAGVTWFVLALDASGDAPTVSVGPGSFHLQGSF